MIIERSAALRRCIPRGASWKSMFLDLSSIWKVADDSFSSIMYSGLIPLVSRCSCKSLKNRMNSLSDLDFTVRIKIILISYSYKTNR